MSTLDSILTHQHLSAHNHRLSSALWIPLNKSYFSRFSNGSEEDYNDDDSTTQGENFNDSRQEINDEETILFTTNLYENIEKFFDENDIHLTSPDEGSNSCKSSKSFIQLKTPVCFEPTATTTTADNDEQLSSMAIPRFWQGEILFLLMQSLLR